MIHRDQSLLRHFNLRHDALFWSDACQEHAARVVDGIESKRLMAIIGSFGVGKSFLVKEAIKSMKNTESVFVSNPDKEKLRIGHVVSSIVGTLSDESPRRDLVARTTQIARIAGEQAVNQKKNLVVVIENAHRLHANTLLALKDMQEGAIYKGHVPLFAIALVGQEPLRGKLDKYGEVKYRTKQLELSEQEGWMTYPERVGYLKAIYGDVITPDMRQQLAAMLKSPLQIDHFLEQKLEMMRDCGIDRLDADQVDVTIREQRQALNASLSDVEKATAQAGSRVPRSTISDVELGKTSNSEAENAVREGLDLLMKKETGQQAGRAA